MVALASLNRETGLILVLLCAVTNYRGGWRAWAWIAVYGALWAVVYVGLRWLLGDAPHTMNGIAGTLAANLQNVPYALTQNLMLAPFLLLALWNYHRARRDVRAYGVVVLAYLGLCAVWALWNEVRLYLTVLPILLVYALSE